ncbi:MAG: di-heme oxidoredictase family protein, partial [Tistlia sp.]
WVSSPSSTASSDGLGPLLNSRSCHSCHLMDGRGHPPPLGEEGVSLFLRLSVPPQDDGDREALAARRVKAIPEPTYGGQLQNFSVQGIPAEGSMVIEYAPLRVTLADGTEVELQKPTYRIEGLNYGPLHPETMTSPRLAPPMIGVGLLEAIPKADILANADPQDADGDGISGRANRVWSDETGRVELGRFGWKAGQPSVAQQTASAFRGDIGISTPLYPQPAGDCTGLQPDCLEAPHGGSGPDDTLEATAEMVEKVDFYSRNLGVPARRDLDDPQVLEGKRVFYEAGCIGCHRPKFVTRRDSLGPEQSFQLIWPYTDLLLHDMGEGLADHRPEGLADGREWRTPPLWGIGLTETVSGRAHYLHDGRARSLLEAILWHGGEAEAARQKVVALPAAEREALLAFLRSL